MTSRPNSVTVRLWCAARWWYGVTWAKYAAIVHWHLSSTCRLATRSWTAVYRYSHSNCVMVVSTEAMLTSSSLVANPNVPLKPTGPRRYIGCCRIAHCTAKQINAINKCLQKERFIETIYFCMQNRLQIATKKINNNNKWPTYRDPIWLFKFVQCCIM